MSIDILNSLRKDIAQQWLDAVGGPSIDLSNDEVFVEVLRLGMQCGRLRQADLCDAFQGVTHTTVGRWINGKHLPRSLYRPMIVSALRHRVAQSIE